MHRLSVRLESDLDDSGFVNGVVHSDFDRSDDRFGATERELGVKPSGHIEPQ
jgi:hypothetical protein